MWRKNKPIAENQVYMKMIDDLVEMIKTGQGQIESERVKEGLECNQILDINILVDQFSELVKKLTNDDRIILAKMLEKQVETGVFETLKLLEEYEIIPFDEGFEGGPHLDFIGRVSDWEWPIE